MVDTSPMADVTFDPAMQAFAVGAGAGARLGDVYRDLFHGWGTTVPAGESPDIGVGGHILGGAYGFLCRLHGLAVDHLHAVEVVVVDASGTARAVTATRAAADPNRDLWWAHTGGGGGNFGIVTRYWLRSPQAPDGAAPAELLPRAPRSVLHFTASWDWLQLDEAGFSRIVRNFGDWCERHGDADSPYAGLFATLLLYPRSAGSIDVEGQFLDAHADDVALVDAFLDADDAAYLAWTRDMYKELFAGTGGVPVPRTAADGAFVNHPDVDLADPRWNTSGVPWSRLYYKDDYPRLQRVKARWDPRNVFRHALSVVPDPTSDDPAGAGVR